MSEKVLKNQLNNVSKTVEVSESLLGNEKSKCDLSHNAKILNVNAKFICRRYLMTGSLSAGFLVFGFAISSLGVSIPTFANNLRLLIDDISPVVVARGCGYLVGSLTAGILEKFLNSFFLILGSLFCLAIGVIFTPLIFNVYALFAFNTLSAIGMSGFETIGNVIVLRMWGAKSEPVIQFLHFWFTFGAAVIPFIMEPFLNDVHSGSINQTLTLNDSNFPEIKTIGNTSIPLIAVPYFFIGSMAILIMFFNILKVPPSFLKKSASQQTDTTQNEGLEFRSIMLIFLFLFYFFYIGFETTMNAFLYSFAVSKVPGMSLSKDSGVHLNTVYLFSFVVGQFSAIFMSKKLDPTTIIVTDLSGAALASIVMSFLPFYGYEMSFVFWIAIAISGIFSASIYGTTFLWAERYITLNARAISTFIIGGSLGEMVLPFPVGLVIEDNPITFLYMCLGYVLATGLTFIIMWKYASSKGERKRMSDVKPDDNEVALT